MNKFILLSVLFTLSFANGLQEVKIPLDTNLSFGDFIKNTDIFSQQTVKELFEYLESLYETSKNPHASTTSIDANLNEYVDELLKQLNVYIEEQNLQVIDIPDISLSIEYKPILITYSGLLNLTEGTLEGLNTIVRNGDIILSYGDKYITLSVPVGIESIVMNYNYRAKIMGIGPRGGIKASVSNNAFSFAVGFDFSSYRADLHDFSIDNIGSISTRFTGNILFDWFLNIASKVVIPFLKLILRNVIESGIYGILESLIESLNAILEKIFA